MKTMIRLLVLPLLAYASQAASIEGDVKFTLIKPLSRATFSREFGDTLKAKCDWRVVRPTGKDLLFAGISVKNTGPDTLWFVYSVAFFDENKKLVGAASMQLYLPEGLAPGKTQSQPCIVYLPEGRYKDIASYQAILYELDAPVFGPKKKPMQLEDPETIAPEIRTNSSRQGRP
jgi:hypothetical protein